MRTPRRRQRWPALAVGTAHVLLALLVEPEGVHIAIFTKFGVDRQSVVDELVRLERDPKYGAAAGRAMMERSLIQANTWLAVRRNAERVARAIAGADSAAHARERVDSCGSVPGSFPDPQARRVRRLPRRDGNHLEALAAGVPVCVVPFCRDQFEVARRVEVSNAGIRLHHRRLTPHRLRNAVRATIRMRLGAQRVAEAFTQAGGARAAADAVEELLPATIGSRDSTPAATVTNAGPPG